MNLHPTNPTYFLVANQGQLELMNTGRVSSLSKDGSIPRSQPRFISASFGVQLRHMIACIGCDFVAKPEKIHDFYITSSAPKGGLKFNKVSKGERGSIDQGRVKYLQVEKTRKIFAIISR